MQTIYSMYLYSYSLFPITPFIFDPIKPNFAFPTNQSSEPTFPPLPSIFHSLGLLNDTFPTKW